MKKTLKTIGMAFAIFVLAFAMTACGSEKMGDNEIADLYNDGYECTHSHCEDNVWKGIFLKDENYDTVKIVTASMSDEDYDTYQNIDYAADNAQDQEKAILTSLTDVTVEDGTEYVPSREEMDTCIGRTFGELEDIGYENSGYSGDDGVYEFYYDGPQYCVTITPEEGTKIDNLDDMSANDIRALKIGSVEFTGFSALFFEQ